MEFPYRRNRRLRKSETIRSMVTETRLSLSDLIVPLFIVEGEGIQEPIQSMPDYFRYSLDLTLKEVEALWESGLKSILLFIKVPEERKDNEGKEALNPDGLMQRAIREIKKVNPEICIMTDVALDPYSKFGHDGIVKENKILNDETNEVLAEMALSHAEAGADFIAPSDMMDGRVMVIRERLESAGYKDTGIMSYSAKYASSFYSPFRDALDSKPGFGDKRSYQMDPGNVREAVKEAQMDVSEGADIVMIKPALAYLDVIKEIRQQVNVPVAAYNVSGEYAMIKSAAANGWLDERSIVMETLTGIKRSGADLIATYFARDIVQYLADG